jgi:hypothetical protein
VKAREPSAQQKESTGPQKHVANKAPGHSVQTKVVNSNVTDMFVAFTMVEQIMTRLSGDALEEKKISVIIKAVSSRLNLNGGNNS